MPYCTPEDVSVITGEVYEGDIEGYLEFWLEAIEIIIDDLIEGYQVEPQSVSLTRKKMVSQLMGAVAARYFQIDPTITSQSLASGDTSESESRLASSSAYGVISRIEPDYIKLLGLKKLHIVSIHTEVHR